MSGTIAPKQNKAGSLATLAQRINEQHRKAEAAMRSGLEHALEAGRLLMEAKGQCKHGTWSDWIKANCEFSERTAQAYMQVVRGWPEIESKAQRVADLSFRQSVQFLAIPCPESEREDWPADWRILRDEALRLIDGPVPHSKDGGLDWEKIDRTLATFLLVANAAIRQREWQRTKGLC